MVSLDIVWSLNDYLFPGELKIVRSTSLCSERESAPRFQEEGRKDGNGVQPWEKLLNLEPRAALKNYNLVFILHANDVQCT